MVLPAAVLGIVLLATPAHAYLDPGSGSMLVQMLLGGLAGGFVLLKLFWRRLVTRLGFRSADESLPDREP